jgi:hypothetical protein
MFRIIADSSENERKAWLQEVEDEMTDITRK